MTERIGVAISTTGDEHRLGLLHQCVRAWDKCLPAWASLFVTVDGDDEAVERVATAVDGVTDDVFRVGQPLMPTDSPRLGVAVNKNTGLELLMDNQRCTHMFLSDDDTWPITHSATNLHLELGIAHSMVCWGKHRAGVTMSRVGATGYSTWNWPRGSMLYVERAVVEQVGGMIEAFGTGGHEHVEWSRRINQAGLTPALYPTPVRYAQYNSLGASRFWHAEDMPLAGESMDRTRARRRRLTSVRRTDSDARRQDQIMNLRDGDTSFVPYRAAENARLSATLYPM